MVANVAKNAEFAKIYSKADRTESEVLHPLLLEMLGEFRDKKVIDYGCGEGSLAKELADRGAYVLGLDKNLEMIQNAREKNQESRTRFDITYDNKTDQPDKSIDAVVSNLVFMMVPSMEEMKNIFDEIYRVLKRDGLFVFSITHPAFLDKEHRTYRTVFPELAGYGKGQKFQFIIKNADGTEITDRETFIDYHYSLQDYLQTIFEAGFRLREFREVWIKRDLYPGYIVLGCRK